MALAGFSFRGGLPKAGKQGSRDSGVWERATSLSPVIVPGPKGGA